MIKSTEKTEKKKKLYSVIVINSLWNLKQQNVLQVYVSPKKKKWKLTIEHNTPPPTPNPPPKKNPTQTIKTLLILKIQAKCLFHAPHSWNMLKFSISHTH